MYRSETAVFRTLLSQFGDRHEPNLSESERSALLRCHGDLTTRMYGAGTLASVFTFGVSRGYPLVVRGLGMAIAGAGAAYYGALSSLRPCLQRIIALEDSSLAAEALRTLEDRDPLHPLVARAREKNQGASARLADDGSDGDSFTATEPRFREDDNDVPLASPPQKQSKFSDGTTKGSAGAVPSDDKEPPKTYRMWKGRLMEIPAPSHSPGRSDARDEGDTRDGDGDDGWSFFESNFASSSDRGKASADESKNTSQGSSQYGDAAMTPREFKLSRLRRYRSEMLAARSEESAAPRDRSSNRGTDDDRYSRSDGERNG